MANAGSVVSLGIGSTMGKPDRLTMDATVGVVVFFPRRKTIPMSPV
jgi:hypothetical protein